MATNLQAKSAVHRGEFVRRFEHSIPQVAKAIGDEIFDTIPGYKALEKDRDARADVERAAERNVVAFVKALGSGKELSKRDIDALGEVGATRAQQGIPLEDVLQAFRTVGRVFWDHLSRELKTPARPPIDVAIELAGTLMRFTDQISSAVARNYSQAQKSIVRRQEAARREFLHDLLLGTWESGESMVERAKSFGYDLAIPHLAIAASKTDGTNPSGDEAAMHRALDFLIEKFAGVGHSILDRREGLNIALIPLKSPAELQTRDLVSAVADQLGEGWRVSAGGSYPGLDGCRRSFLEAKEAFEIGFAVEPTKSVHLFDDYLLYRFLRGDAELAERFVDAVLGPVVEHDLRRRSDLVQTLEAYFSTDRSAKRAGEILYAHPHTVTYRLKQIERLTGRSFRSPEDKLHMHIAVKALRLSEGASRNGSKATTQEH